MSRRRWGSGFLERAQLTLMARARLPAPILTFREGLEIRVDGVVVREGGENCCAVLGCFAF